VQFDDCPLKNFLVNESEPGGRLARVRFAPKADKSPHRSEMTRWAKRRHQATENPAILAGALEVEELFGQRQVARLGDQLARRLPAPVAAHTGAFHLVGRIRSSVLDPQV
jgi:hypothetical protein